ncbi:TIGR01457 family HAD-type hydrolase [Paenibacillus daejeonensis]|uniref:TIGR01457 family HAD-type hydrolase n=1 Tax=Paenibacillus daejeonensis TaxID=135193 RepID=UPI000365854C|nr:TIGR01457 family HAD-type hydrolase [Paenibacillus daejeonensis]
MTSTAQLPSPAGLLIDLDGTIYHGGRMIEGADEWIASLIARGVPHLFVTNNSTVNPQTFAARLQAMGIPAEPEQVCTSAQAAASYIALEQPGAAVFVIGEDGLREAVTTAGLRVVESDADVVLQGLDRNLSYESLTRAVRLIHSGARYVLTNPDLLLPVEDGVIPGSGSISALLQAAGGQKPVVIGKPSGILVNYALDRMGTTAEQTWMVGDNLLTDIAAGVGAGCPTALVLTGITNQDNLASYVEQAGVRPDVIFENLHELQTYISERLGR